MGIGAICHTVNPRLFPDQIAWIIDHAQDRVVMTDITFVPILEKIADKLTSVERYVVLTDKAHMPQTTLKNAVPYEDWIAEADGDFKWKTFDENTAAAMCYTSGTTGDPKGVLYSHRSNVLHALMANTGDSLGANAKDTMLPVVPLFHANSWGIAFSAPSMGTKLVFPGAKLDGASVFELLESEKVTHTAGVPTVWLMLLNHIAANKLKLPHLRFVVCGGSAMPRTMIKAFVDMGVTVRHAWGMTEMSPIGTLAALKPPFAQLTGDARLAILQTPGYPPFGVQMKITAEAAVIGIYHPKWDERALLIVQLKQGQGATREDILKYMDGKIAKWWMPDDVVFVEGIPHTATGKILKTALRDQFKAYSFPNAAA